MPDLALVRRDLGVFSSVVGADLADWQAADLLLDKPITCLLWGRQLGKSLALALAALHAAFGAPERKVLIVSGGGELGARRLLSEVRQLVAGSGLLSGSRVDESASLVTLLTGSEIRCVAGSEASIRGWRAHRLLADEAQLLTEDQWSAALPVLAAAEGGRAVLAGTASAASGPFFDLFRRGEVGDEHVHSSRRVSRFVGGPDAAPWQVPSMIEAQLATMSETRANAEHRCIWQSESDTLLSRAAVERVTADYRSLTLATLPTGPHFFGGQDWGWSADRSASVVVGRLPIRGDHGVLGVAATKRWRAGAALHEVVSELIDSPGYFARLVPEANGLGAQPSADLVTRMRERPPEAGGGRPPAPRIFSQEDGSLHDWLDGGTGRLERGWRTRSAGTAFRDRSDPPPSSPQGFRTRVEPLHVTQDSKAAAYGAVHGLIQREQLLIPREATDLVRELLLLRVDLAPGGGERIEARGTAADDLADALALCTAPYRDRSGRWRTRMADLAKVPLPASAPEAHGPFVTSGDGIAVPRDPGWQSVEGPVVHPERVEDDPFASVRRQIAARMKGA